jgi:hypothetical protein
LQEALPDRSISTVELLPQLQEWADEARDAERCKLLSKKAVRDAFAARILQVRLGILRTALVRGLVASAEYVQQACCCLHDQSSMCMVVSKHVLPVRSFILQPFAIVAEPTRAACKWFALASPLAYILALLLV